MNALREAFESLGFLRVATFLGSGNVVFETRARDVGTLERKIERRLQQALGYEVRVFLRTHAELKEISAFEPFENTVVQGADLNIIFLAHDLDEGPKAKLVAPRTRMDGFRVHGREIYWWRRKRPGTSLFSTVPLAKMLRVFRSTNTIRKLVEISKNRGLLQRISKKCSIFGQIQQNGRDSRRI